MPCIAALVLACGDGRGCGASGGPCEDDPDDAGDVRLTFTYDANGARIQQVEGEITRRYLGDDYEIEVGGVSSSYILVGDVLVARTDGTTAQWVHVDHLGSIQAETDASASETHRKKYRPYGEILSSDGSFDDESRGYIGQRHDASGLVFLHARYYDPALGRLISPDTIISGPDTIGLNRYAYADNDPVNKKDVNGHLAFLAALVPIAKGIVWTASAITAVLAVPVAADEALEKFGVSGETLPDKVGNVFAGSEQPTAKQPKPLITAFPGHSSPERGNEFWSGYGEHLGTGPIPTKAKEDKRDEQSKP